MQQKPTIKDLWKLRDWRKEHAGHLFKTDTQLDWFVRTNRRRLIESGTYIPGAGRRPSLVTSEFDQVVTDILMGVDNAA